MVPSYSNPVISGFHPDPSVCRVGDDYFLVTSSFAYYPGLPVHHSTDLVSWTHVGYVLTDTAGVDLDGFDVSDGVWAATIRFWRGTFYVVYSVARDRTGVGTFVTTATDAAGPWSPPRRLEADGIDPSLFFDDDGRCWLTATRDAADPERTGPGEIWMRELDVESLTLVGPEHVLWHGAVHGQWVEAPRVFRRGSRYHLIAAEGGTERHHAVTAAVSDSPTGPYRTDRRSPLLTHRHLGETSPVQNVGHADLVDAPDGSTWAVALGVRVVDGVHTLGREVFLVPVAWEATGPVFAPGTGVVPALRGPDAESEVPPARWMSLRGPVPHRVEGDAVVLPPGPDPLTSGGRPAFVGRPQERHRFAFEATVDLAPDAGDEAGLVAFQNQHAFVSITVHGHGAAAVVEVVEVAGGRSLVHTRTPVRGAVRLGIRSDGRRYELGLLHDDGFEVLGAVSHRALSTEVAGGFVGVVLGLVHRGAADAQPVTFERVAYGSLPDAAAASTGGASSAGEASTADGTSSAVAVTG